MSTVCEDAFGQHFQQKQRPTCSDKVINTIVLLLYSFEAKSLERFKKGLGVKMLKCASII